MAKAQIDLGVGGGSLPAELETAVIAVGATYTVDCTNKNVMYIVWYDSTLSPALAGSVYENNFTQYGRQSSNLVANYNSTTKTLSITNNHSIAYNLAYLS